MLRGAKKTVLWAKLRTAPMPVRVPTPATHSCLATLNLILTGQPGASISGTRTSLVTSIAPLLAVRRVRVG